MLYWICPECGHECSPAIRECPTCTAAEKAAPATTDILSLAQNFQSAPVATVSAPAPVRSAALASNGHSASSKAAVLIAEPEPEPRPPSKLAPLEELEARPSRPTSLEPRQLSVSPLPPPAAAPVVALATRPSAELGLKPAGLVPIGDISFEAAPGVAPQAPLPQAEPAPSRRQSIAFVRGALPGASVNGLALADLTQSNQARITPVAPQTAPALAPTAVHPKAGALAFISSKLALAGESLSELKQAAIQTIQASFQEQPPALLLCAAEEVVAAPAPPAAQWLHAPRTVFLAKEPGYAGLEALIAGPQTPTLAGPCLPPQLQQLYAGRSLVQRPHKKRPAAPAWMLSVLVAIMVFLGAGSLLQYLSANRDAKAASVPQAQAQPQISVPAPTPLPVAREHPGARFVEVAGVRVVTAPNRRPQLQYIVINHSAGELTGLNIHIAVRSADSSGGPPLFGVSSVIPLIGPNQSKEIRTDLDASVSAASIPDWQSLRTEILVARQ